MVKVLTILIQEYMLWYLILSHVHYHVNRLYSEPVYLELKDSPENYSRVPLI